MIRLISYVRKTYNMGSGAHKRRHLKGRVQAQGRHGRVPASRRSFPCCKN